MRLRAPVRRLPSVLAVALALAPASAAGRQDGAVDERAFRAFVEERAIELDPERWPETGPEAFAFLDEALAGKRIVFLGESDHRVAERVEFRLLLLRELARRGFRRIGMEMGHSDAKRMDAYLATGDESWLERVALYGWRGDLREDRVDAIRGWTDDSDSDSTRSALDEARGFLRRLRALGESLEDGPRLSWFGYDLSFRPGGGYADVRELLAEHADAPLALELERRMARVAGESRLAEAERLEATVAWLAEREAELTGLVGETAAREAPRALLRMADAFRFIEAMQGLDREPDVVTDALRVRERAMARNLDQALAEWPADEKIVLLGHALHLSKDSERLHTPDRGALWRTIGTHVAREHPGEVWGAWLLHDRGRHGVPRAEPPVLPFRSPRGSIERTLARVHEVLVLPLGSHDPREAWLAEERVVSMGGSPARAVVPRQTDCLFFVRTASPPGSRVGVK